MIFGTVHPNDISSQAISQAPKETMNRDNTPSKSVEQRLESLGYK